MHSVNITHSLHNSPCRRTELECDPVKDHIWALVSPLLDTTPTGRGIFLYFASSTKCRKFKTRFDDTGVLENYKEQHPNTVIMDLDLSGTEASMKELSYHISSGKKVIVFAVYRSRWAEGFNPGVFEAFLGIYIGDGTQNLGGDLVVRMKQFCLRLCSRIPALGRTGPTPTNPSGSSDNKDASALFGNWLMTDTAAATNQPLGRTHRRPTDSGAIVMVGKGFCTQNDANHYAFQHLPHHISTATAGDMGTVSNVIAIYTSWLGNIAKVDGIMAAASGNALTPKTPVVIH